MAKDTTEDPEKQSTANSEAEVSEKRDAPARHVCSPPTSNGSDVFHHSGSSKFNFLYLGYRNPPSPKASLDDADIIPEANANWLSLLTFEWISPLMRLGYSRPLEATDLYKLQDYRSAGVIAERITRSFEERQRKAEEYNSRLANGEISPGLKGIWWSIRGQRQQREKEWREKTGKKKASLTMAVNDSVFWFFWSAGVLRLISDVSLITSPLLVKVIPAFSPNLTHLTSPLGHHSVRPTFLCRPPDWTGRPSACTWCRSLARPLLPSGSGLSYFEPLFLSRFGYWCLVACRVDHRDL